MARFRIFRRRGARGGRGGRSCLALLLLRTGQVLVFRNGFTRQNDRLISGRRSISSGVARFARLAWFAGLARFAGFSWFAGFTRWSRFGGLRLGLRKFALRQAASAASPAAAPIFPSATAVFAVGL